MTLEAIYTNEYPLTANMNSKNITNRVTPVQNSLLNSVVMADSTNLFKSHLNSSDHRMILYTITELSHCNGQVGM